MEAHKKTIIDFVGQMGSASEEKKGGYKKFQIVSFLPFVLFFFF